jgi:16S rRNA (cytidine1402-2'-O)-methyltransferase
MEKPKGILYLVPCTLGDTDPLLVIPLPVIETIRGLNSFIVENSKSARAFLKMCAITTPQSDLIIKEIDKHDPHQDVKSLMEQIIAGNDTGLLSEAGLPAIADPGSSIVKYAHQHGIKVMPLSGPSSVLLALIGSGMNGQQFCFNGYLPIDNTERIKALQRLERETMQTGKTQIFIETPYRNNNLLKDITANLNPALRLCIAANVTLPDEMIRTLTIREWKKNLPELHKIPVVFCLGE